MSMLLLLFSVTVGWGEAMRDEIDGMDMGYWLVNLAYSGIDDRLNEQRNSKRQPTNEPVNQSFSSLPAESPIPWATYQFISSSVHCLSIGRYRPLTICRSFCFFAFFFYTGIEYQLSEPWELITHIYKAL